VVPRKGGLLNNIRCSSSFESSWRDSVIVELFLGDVGGLFSGFNERNCLRTTNVQFLFAAVRFDIFLLILRSLVSLFFL